MWTVHVKQKYGCQKTKNVKPKEENMPKNKNNVKSQTKMHETEILAK